MPIPDTLTNKYFHGAEDNLVLCTGTVQDFLRSRYDPRLFSCTAVLRKEIVAIKKPFFFERFRDSKVIKKSAWDVAVNREPFTMVDSSLQGLQKSNFSDNYVAALQQKMASHGILLSPELFEKVFSPLEQQFVHEYFDHNQECIRQYGLHEQKPLPTLEGVLEKKLKFPECISVVAVPNAVYGLHVDDLQFGSEFSCLSGTVSFYNIPLKKYPVDFMNQDLSFMNKNHSFVRTRGIVIYKGKIMNNKRDTICARRDLENALYNTDYFFDIDDAIIEKLSTPIEEKILEFYKTVTNHYSITW